MNRILIKKALFKLAYPGELTTAGLRTRPTITPPNVGPNSFAFSVPVSAPATTKDREYRRLSRQATKNGWKLNNGTWTSPSGRTYAEDQVLQTLTARRRSGVPAGGPLTLTRNQYGGFDGGTMRSVNGRNVMYAKPSEKAIPGTYYFGSDAAKPKNRFFINGNRTEKPSDEADELTAAPPVNAISEVYGGTAANGPVQGAGIQNSK